ncbi:MAG TPA: TIGR03067 domain-containing protein [Gemmataceae bacterium]|nr:TIGR03067 domain-containing protein [Gemmataceae bacterium]
MHRRVVTVGIALMLSLPVLLPAGDAPKSDQELEGEWEPQSAVLNGSERPKPPPDIGGHVSIHGDCLVWAVGSRVTMKYHLDIGESMSTKTVNFTWMLDDHDKGTRSLGIYEVKDDVLRICLAKPGNERPTEFSSKEGSGRNIIVLRRRRDGPPMPHADD